MTEASKELVEKLRYLQNEIREQKKEQIIRDAEIEARKAEINSRLERVKEQHEKIDSLRNLLDSAEEHQRRQLVLAKTGRREFFREDPEEPQVRIRIDPRDGSIY